MVKVLVTGGAGFIGSHTVDALLERGYDVSVLDNLLYPVHLNGLPSYFPKEVEFIQGDVSDKRIVAQALQGTQVVLHLAAYQGFLPDFSTFFRTNTVSTALIFELVVEKKLPVQKVIIASSQAVYGEGKHLCPQCGVQYPPPRPVEQLLAKDWEVKCPRCGARLTPLPTDEAVVNPATQYAVSKYTQEMIALNLGRRYSIPVTCLRYSITQGARQSFSNAYSGILRIFCLRMLNGHRPVAYEDGEMQRDYVHVKDVVKANLLALDDPRTDYEVYNVGSGQPTKVLEYAAALAKKLGKDIEPLLPGEFRLGDVRHIISDISKLRRLGWEPVGTLDEILGDYIAWVMEQPDIQDYFQEAEQVLKQTGVIRSG